MFPGECGGLRYIFDLDGTITDTNGLWAEVDREFLARRGLAPTPEYQRVVERSIYPIAAAFTREHYGLPDSPQEIMAEWDSLARRHSRELAPRQPGAEDVLRPRLPRGQLPGVAPGQAVPLRHDFLGRVGQPVMLPGECRRNGVNGALHHPLVLWRGGQSPAGKKLPVHLRPQAVGVGNRAVQVKYVSQAAAFAGKHQITSFSPIIPHPARFFKE